MCVCNEIMIMILLLMCNVWKVIMKILLILILVMCVMKI